MSPDDGYREIIRRIRALEHQVDILRLGITWRDNVIWMREQELRLAGVEPMDTETQCPF